MYSSVTKQCHKAALQSLLNKRYLVLKRVKTLWAALADNQKQLGVSCITQEEGIKRSIGIYKNNT